MSMMELPSQEKALAYQEGIEQGLDVVGSPAVAMQRFAQKLKWFKQTTSVDDEQELALQQHELTALSEMLGLLAKTADVAKKFMDLDVGRAEFVQAMSELRSNLAAQMSPGGPGESGTEG